MFVTLIWGKDKEEITRIVTRASIEFSNQQKEIYTSCNLRLSTGLYFIDDLEENLDMAIENANIARKSIKGSTEFCRVYESRMRKQRELEKQILSDFQSDLAESRFQVYIQPKFLLDQLELSGGEALVRLKKRDGSMESPGCLFPYWRSPVIS